MPILDAIELKEIGLTPQLPVSLKGPVAQTFQVQSTVRCPYCSEEVELDDSERTSKKFTSPTYNKLVELNPI